MILTCKQIQVVNTQTEKILPAIPGSLGRFLQDINGVIQNLSLFCSCTSGVNCLPVQPWKAGSSVHTAHGCLWG